MPHHTDSGDPGPVAALDQRHAEALQLLREAQAYCVVAVRENGEIASVGSRGDDRDDELRLALALLKSAKHVTGWEWEGLAEVLSGFAEDEEEEPNSPPSGTPPTGGTEPRSRPRGRASEADSARDGLDRSIGCRWNSTKGEQMPHDGDSPDPGLVARRDQERAEALELLRDARAYCLVAIDEDAEYCTEIGAAAESDTPAIADGLTRALKYLTGMEYAQLSEVLRNLAEAEAEEAA